MEDCNGNEVLLRTSGFADFGNQPTPNGNGTVVGVLTKYLNDYQLYIRNLDDVSMPNARCGGGGTGGATLTDIASVRALFTGAPTTAPAGIKIKGIVISDRFGKNLNDRNLYLQDASGGIVVRYTANHCFDLGDEIEVNISNQEISEFNALRQVNNVPIENSVRLSSGNTVQPRVATIAEINANYNTWESTLVQINGATITGGATYSGNKTVTDATGSIAMFTQSYSTFANQPVKSGSVTITAIVSDFNGKQIVLRNLSDVQ